VPPAECEKTGHTAYYTTILHYISRFGVLGCIGLGPSGKEFAAFWGVFFYPAKTYISVNHLTEN